MITEQKIKNACIDLEKLMADHYASEAYSGNINEDAIDVRTFSDGKIFSVEGNFSKYGNEIYYMSDREIENDDDYPDFIGEKIILEMIEKAASMNGFKLNNKIKAYVHDLEKGFLLAGYKVSK